MWFEDNDPALLLASQQCTPKHPNYLPVAKCTPCTPLPSLTSVAGTATVDDNATAPAASERDNTSATETTDDGSTGIAESQIGVLPPTLATPKKQVRPNSPTETNLPPPLPGTDPNDTNAFHPTVDTYLIVFTITPFVMNNEFRAAPLDRYLQDASAIG